MTETANRDQLEAWNGDSGRRWVADADRRDAILAPIADLLSHHAAIAPGESVLDIGCGCGATAIAAATATGNGGAVTGLDLSAPMLDRARHRVAEAGLRHLRFVQGDAQTQRIGETFDVATSRFGTMFFADPTAAFTNIGRHLRPGGRLCIATWQPLAANEWLVVPGAALLTYGILPAATSPDSPGMFAQSEPDTIRTVLADAGFTNINPDPQTLTLRFGSTIEEAVAYLADSGPGRAVLDTIPDNQRDTALDAVRTVLAGHADELGVHLDAAIWITTARLPR
jgi:ubiquinone/menaquinone biosynthesis C-methylase UbiE